MGVVDPGLQFELYPVNRRALLLVPEPSIELGEPIVDVGDDDGDDE